MRIKVLLSLLFVVAIVNAQRTVPEINKLQLVTEVPVTSVKNQERSSTCWSFATLSMIESELLSKTGKKYNLSEMWIVRHTYIEKAVKYVRMQGKISFSGGGETNDVTDVWDKYGVVPESVYKGKRDDLGKINHKEMDFELKKYVKKVVKEGVKADWLEGYEAILDEYIGEVPDKFLYKRKRYTPKSFAASLPVNTEDYILIGSYTHHPFYSSFVLEVPDNWSWGKLYNLPLNEFKMVLDSSLLKGYSASWAADVSETGFNWSEGYATVIPGSVSEQSDSDVSGALGLDDLMNMKVGEKKAITTNIEITQELRQKHFDSQLTTDDHGMHIVGLFVDESGRFFYKIKNSWGVENKLKGFIYVSDKYYLLKSTSVMINKNSLPEKIKKKLNL